MRLATRRGSAAGLTVAMLATGLVMGTAPATAATPDLGQKVAVPAYIPPSDTASWTSLTAPTPQLDFVVVNVANGPDTAVNPQWKTIIDKAHANGTKVLGYVDSGYFGASVPARKTVPGDTDATSWTVQAQQDVDRWYQYYGSSIDGIFVDDGMNVCGPTAGSNEYADLYSELNNYIHGTHPGSLTVVNPGITVPECYESTGDVIVTFEGNVDNYLNPPAELAPAQWQLDADPNKIWEIVYNVTEAQLPAATARSKQNNAGYFYATPDTLPNPYDTAPTGSYWSSELAGTTATGSGTPATPARPRADDVYSTGVDLSWASSASSSVVGYEVYRDGLRVGTVGNYYPDRTDFTDVALTPATAYSYTVRARNTFGTLSAVGPARAITTTAIWGDPPGAPGSVTVSELKANSVKLSWTASTTTNDPVAFYDVYVDGARKVSVNDSVTSIRLGYLSPGVEYGFDVRARSTSNATSVASAPVIATTPNPQPIENATVGFGATTTVFDATYNLTYNFQNVFIDTDGQVATGYQVGGIGADYLLQGGTFFRHATGANTFDWASIPLADGPLISSTGGAYHWEVPSSEFGSATTLQVVFNGSGSSPDVTLPVITATR